MPDHSNEIETIETSAEQIRALTESVRTKLSEAGFMLESRQAPGDKQADVVIKDGEGNRFVIEVKDAGPTKEVSEEPSDEITKARNRLAEIRERNADIERRLDSLRKRLVPA